MFTMNGSLDALNDEYAAKVWPAILFLSVVMVVGSLGNILVCAVYWFDLSKVNNRFVLAVAGIDLVNCLISIPGEISCLIFNYSFGDSKYCPTKNFTQTFCSMASVSILVAISVERFQKICKPYGKQTTLQTSTAAIFTSILLALVLATPSVIGERRKAGFVQGVPTVECHREHSLFNKIYNTFLFLLFIIGCLIIVILYGFIWNRLRKQRYFRNQLRCQSSEDNLNTVQIKHACFEKADDDNSNDQAVQENISTTSITLTSKSEPIFLPLTSYNSASMSPSQPVIFPSKATSLTPSSKSTSLATTSIELSSDDNRNDEESSNPPLNEYDRGNRTAKMKPLFTSTKVDKTTIIMLLVSVVFILSFLPYLCLSSSEDIYPKSFQNLTSVQLASYQLFYRSHFLNSALNPFIYSFLNLQFRGQLWNLRKRFMRKLGRG